MRCVAWLASFLILACVVLLGASSLWSPARAQGTNLLTNPGFEGGTSGWHASPTGNVTFSITTTLTHSGASAAQLTALGLGTYQYIYQVVPGITPGAVYDLSGYGYIPDASISSMVLQVLWYSSADCTTGQLPAPVFSNPIHSVGVYQPMSAPPSVAPSSARCAMVQASITTASPSGGSAIFDDLSLITTSATNTATATATPTETGTPLPTSTATATATPTPTRTPISAKLLIVQVLYDGTQPDEGDEFITVLNPNSSAVLLDGYKIGDEETQSGSESMYRFPNGYSLAPNAIVTVARNAAYFRARFGANPTFELSTTGVFTDTAAVGNLVPYATWATGSLALSNSGDEILLLGPSDQRIDSVAWANGDFARTGLTGNAKADEPLALLRYGTQDTDNMTLDFMRAPPNPTGRYTPPGYPAPVPPARIANGLSAFWGDLHAHSTVSDGSGPPRQAFAVSRAAGLHFAAVVDHDADITSLEWSEMGQAANTATVDGAFIALRGFEYTNPRFGHIGVLDTDNWVSHDDPAFASLSQFYAWLASQPRAIAQFNHPALSTFDRFALNPLALDKVVLQEVGNNGDGVYKRYDNAYIASLNQRWRVAPTNNSDHHGTNWGSDSPHRVGILAPALTRPYVLDALRSRRVFSTEDSNLALALAYGAAWMGATVQASPILTFTLIASDPEPEPLNLQLLDNGQVVWSHSFPNSTFQTSVSIPGGSLHYYLLRAAQADGDIAYTAPIWTDGTVLPVTPALPRDDRNDLGRVSIQTARTTALHKRVSLEGCITVPPGILSDRFLYMQDATAGIRVYLPSRLGNFPPLRWGDLISVRGTTETRTSEREVELAAVSDVKTVGSCTVTPVHLPTGGLNTSLEGTLVEISGQVVAGENNDWVVTDGSGNANVHLDPTAGLRSSTFTRGLRYSIAGILTHYRNGTVLTPRLRSDVVLSQPPTRTPTPTITARAPRTLTPTPTATPTRLTARALMPEPTVTLEPRAFVRPTSVPSDPPSPIQAQALATVGGTVFAGTGGLLMLLALALIRRR